MQMQNLIAITDINEKINAMVAKETQATQATPTTHLLRSRL